MSPAIFLLTFLLNIPSIIPQPFDIEILDKCSANSQILDLKKLNLNQNQDQMRYSLSGIYEESVYFEIKEDKLYTKSTIDIDSMCSQIMKCCNKEMDYCDLKISFLYTTLMNSVTNSRTLQIHIRDINDHTPRFETTAMDIELSESKKEPFLITLPLANDVDFGRNRIQNYEIGLKEPYSFDEYFSLLVNKERSVPFQVNLRLNKMLDRESINKFTFELLAIDGDMTMKKTGTVSITIKVTDENDNRPIFQRNLYKEKIREGFFNNLPILTLTATDTDEGENAKILYQLSPNFNNDFIINDKFRIESNGKIYLKKALDYEKRDLYRFNVIATNPTPFMNNRVGLSTATVEIEVENVNDEPLKLIVDYPTGKNYSQVLENAPDFYVAYLTARSTESGHKFMSINCILQSYTDKFELLPKNNDDVSTKSYEIRTKVGIDREMNDVIKTNIICRESNSPLGKSSEIPLVVLVVDENDNTPELRIEGETIVMENEVLGKVIFTVKAKDPDKSENGRISFSMDKSDPASLEFLKIGEVDGKVRVKNKIDCEAQFLPLTFFEVTVTATDHGRPPKFADLKFRVNVKDVNDNFPIFRTNPLEFSIIENNPKYTFVNEIEVYDADHTDKVTVRIANNKQLSLPFIITTKDNKIFYLNTTKPIDRERDAIFTFVIVATDGSDKSTHSVSATVEVKVIDVNDNPPTIIFPTQNNASVHRLSYLEPPNHKLILVSANDQDQPPDNSRLEFLVEDDSKIFGITSEEKSIITEREMTKSDMGDHVIRIIVRDYGTPRLETSITINVVIDQSSPKSLSYNNKNTYGNGDRTLEKSFSGSFDITLCIIIVVILLFVVIVIIIVVYVIHRCRSDDNSPCYHYLTCFKHLQSSPTVSKSMISAPTSKFNYSDDKQTYNHHQLTMMNDEQLIEENNRNEQWNQERNRLQSYNTVGNPNFTSKSTYTKLSNSPQYFYNSAPYQHIYQTIQDQQLAQRKMDLILKGILPNQIKGKNTEQYKSEINLNRWNSMGSDSNEFFPTGSPWVTSQTPLPTRSRNVTNTILDGEESEENFAVAFPQDQSTFV